MKRQPDIILVLPDQLRRDVCGPYGGRGIPTPAMDRLAAEGLVVDNAISPVPVCTPYRGMLMTGRYPTHSGVLNNFVEISPQQNPHPLAVVLAAAGYDTAYIGKWHLAAGEYGAAAPHPAFVPPGPRRMGFRRWAAYNFHMDSTAYWFYRDTPEKQYDARYETDAIFAEAIRILCERRTDAPPLFMVVAPHAPHPPFAADYAPPGYLDRVPREITWTPNVPPHNPRSAEEMRVYLAMVSNVDENLGQLLEAIDDVERSDDTMLIFTSDHGEMHGSHGRLNKMVPYSEAIDMPLLIRRPGVVPQGARSEAIVTPMDFLPTLAAVGNAEAPTAVDGQNLTDVLTGRRLPEDREVLLANYSSHWNYFRSETPDTAPDWRCWPEWRGVRTLRHTYVRWLDGREELYDNQADPFQLSNLLDGAASTTDGADVASQLRRVLDRLLVEAHDDFRPGDRYQEWFDTNRRLRATGLGPVPRG